MVVDTACLPEPASNSANTFGRRAAGDALGATTRAGAASRRARARRSIMYSYSGESLGRAVVRRHRRRRAPRRGSRPGGRAGRGAARSCVLGHLLDLVGGVAALDVGAERPALDRLGEDDGRRALVLDGRLVGGVELAVVVAAAGQVAQLVVGEVLDHACAAGGRGRRSARGCRRRDSTAYFWNSPSTVVFILLSSTPSMSRASSSSHFEPQMTLMTFQPAPRNTASSSWMILPLPRTGPSRRCRLQLTTKIRLSSCSRAASESAPSDSGSSHLAVADEAPHLRLGWCRRCGGCAGSG